MTTAAPFDEAAFDALFRRLERPVYNVVYRWVWDREEAHDLVQEAFVRLWGMRRRVRVESVEPLVYRIALNLAANRRRSKKLWGWVGLDRSATRAPGDAHAALESDERDRAVRAAVEALPEPLRRVVALCEFSDLSYAQVADALDIKVGTVGSRRNAALAQLRDLLEASHG